ncbi:DoxX family protein [Streptomyces sp. URMC 129]|uniref:DoxX family protein n=1 Tax=Streptomyces sp. URMC 129 TaxID=3423407 RepID=UPI003F1D12F0
MLSLFRIVVGLLFACHGFGALFGLISPAAGPIRPTPSRVGDWPYWYAALIELVGGTLVMLAVGTRAIALVGSGETAYAYVGAHAFPRPWPIDNGGELPALCAWAFLLQAVTGPGRR